jgi:hypothetical protein
MKHLLLAAALVAAVASHAATNVGPIAASGYQLKRGSANVGAPHATSAQCWSAAAGDAETRDATANYSCNAAEKARVVWTADAPPAPVPTVEYDTRIGLGATADGTPILARAEGARVIYADPSSPDASDANPGTDRAKPKATVNAAWAALRTGVGDWLAIACGSHPQAFGVLAARSGKSVQHPIVVTTYNAAGELRACDATLTGQSPHLLLLIEGQRAIVFERITINPGPGNDGLLMVLGGGPRDLLFFRFRVLHAHWSIQGGGMGTPPITGIVVRRSGMGYSYKATGHHQGFYGWNIDGLTIEDSVFYHNGWQSDRNEVTEDKARLPNVFKHNTYLGTLTWNVIYRRNLNGHASSHGLQARGGGTVVDNVFRANPLALLIGGGDNHNTFRPEGVQYLVRGNVIDGSANIDNVNRRGMAMDFINTAAGSATDNITANIGPWSTYNQYPLTWSATLAGVKTNVDVRDNVWWSWPGPAPSLTAANVTATFTGNVFPNADMPGNLRAPVVPYPDPTRTTATWAASQGFASEDAMWQAAIADPMRNWASEIRAHIRAGFAR